MEQVKGYVVATLFHNVNNHYSIIKIRIDQKKDEKLTIVGYFDIPEKNELIMYHGEYVDHERFGRQFKAEFIEKVLPNSNEAVIRFLSSSSMQYFSTRRRSSRLSDNLTTPSSYNLTQRLFPSEKAISASQLVSTVDKASSICASTCDISNLLIPDIVL